MNILHFIIDDKFFQFIHDEFSTLKGVKNKYVAVLEDKDQSTKHISSMPLWRKVDKGYLNSEAIENDFAWCDAIIVHYLHLVAAKIVLLAPKNKKLVWSGWGGDYFYLFSGGESALLEKDTSLAMRKINYGWPYTYKKLKQISKKILNDTRLAYQEKHIILPAISRFDLFSSPIPEDYSLIRSELGSTLQAEYCQINYGSAEKTFQIAPNALCGENILIGNSATDTNNHIEAIDIITDIDIGSRSIIIPLSYGLDEYANYITKYAKKKLGDRVKVVRNFMPLQDYNSFILQCGYAVMNQKRQQALGNIGTLLYNGARVILNDESTVFRFFKKKGAIISSMEELKYKKEQIFSKLTEDEILHNRDVVLSFWGASKVRMNHELLISRLS